MSKTRAVATTAAFIIAAMSAGAALAQTSAPAPTQDSATIVPRSGFGGETDVWMAMQLNPAYTANDSRPIPGEVANRTFVRYLGSFTHPIPEQFERQSFSGSGAGTGGGGSAPSSGAGGGSSSP